MSRNRTVGLFLLVTLLFGTAFPAVKTGLSFIPPLLFAAARSYLAAALLLVYVGATTGYWYPRSRRDVTAVLAGGVFLVGGTGIGFVAQQFITAGVAAVNYPALLAPWGRSPRAGLPASATRFFTRRGAQGAQSPRASGSE